MVRQQLISSITLGDWNTDGLYKHENKSRIIKLNEEEIMNKIWGLTLSCSSTVIATRMSISVSLGTQYIIRSGQNQPAPESILFSWSDQLSHFLPSSNPQFVWIKLCHSYFRLQHDLYVLTVYICSENPSFIGEAGDTFRLIETIN